MIRPAYAPWRHTFVLAATLVVGVAIAVHLGVLGHGFTLDDEGIIQRNPLVHSLSGVWRAFGAPWWPEVGGQYRPLVLAVFTVEWWIGGGSPAVFHASNLLWHALVVLLVMQFTREVASLGAAIVAGLLFAVHPVHVEAIAGIVGRAELMAAAGVLAALLLHRRGSWWSVLAYALALLSKEHAIVFPVLALAMDHLVPTVAPHAASAEAQRAWRLRRSLRYLAYGAVVAAWITIVALLFRGAMPVPAHPLWLALSAPSRWLTMLGVVPTWLRLFVAPADLSVDYAPAVLSAWPAAWPAALLGAGLLLGAMAALAHAWRRAPSAALAGVWIGVTLLPVANLLLPTGIVTAERVLYLPSVGVVLLAALGVARAARESRASQAVLTLALVVAIAFAARSITRVPAWASNKEILLTTLREHPESSFAHALLGRVYLSNRATDQALDAFRTAAELFPEATAPWLDAARTAVAAGRHALADSLLARGLTTAAQPYDLWMARASLARDQLDGERLVAAAGRASALRPDLDAPRLLAVQGWLLLAQADSARVALGEIREAAARAAAADQLRAAFGGR